MAQRPRGRRPRRRRSGAAARPTVARHPEPGDRRPDQREPDGLVPGQRAEPDQHAQGQQPRIGQPGPRGSRAIRVISRHAPSTMTVNGTVESGTVAPRTRGGRRRSSARCRWPATVPGPGASCALGDVRGEPPGEDRHQRPDAATDDDCEDANVVPNRAIGTAARNVGSGSQTSKAARGTISGGVW